MIVIPMFRVMQLFAFLGTTVTSTDDTLALQSSAAGSGKMSVSKILDRTGSVIST